MKHASRTHDAESTLLGKQKTRGGKEVAKNGEASEGSHLVQRCTFIYIYMCVRARILRSTSAIYLLKQHCQLAFGF